MIDGTHYNTLRGTTQPETAEQKRKRLHREAADDVKQYARALKEAKERYHAYDAPMDEQSQTPRQIEEPELRGGDTASRQSETPA
jgi:hypothetical protein